MARIRPNRTTDQGVVSLGLQAVTVRLPGETAVRVGRILHQEGMAMGCPTYLVLDRHLHSCYEQIAGWEVSGAVTTELRWHGAP